jgi:hypothetical protein
MPYQVTSNGWRAAAVGAIVACLAGCAEGARAPQFAPFQVADTGATRVTVYGSVVELLPHFDVTPALDRFLYGPNDYGKAILRNPQGLDTFGNLVLVCDQGQPDVIAVHLETGKSAGWGDERHRPRCPVDVAVDDAGQVFVADTTMRSVLVFDAAEKFVAELSPDPDVKRKFRPCSLLVSKGILYVGDFGRHRVERWDCAARRWLDPLAAPAGAPTMVAPTGLAMTPDGVLLVVDTVQGLVYRLGLDGKARPPIGRPGRSNGQFVRPKQVCCTKSGHVLVTDAGRQSVLVFRADGTYVTEIHEEAGKWRGLTMPAGLLAVSESDTINQCVESHGWTPSEEYVIVSDTLGPAPLVLIGIGAVPQRGPNAR